MFLNFRRRFRLACWGGLLGLSLTTLAGPAGAVSITGIMVMATDDFGAPNGRGTFINGELQAQAWRTLVNGSIWYGLGVTEGLPPESIDKPLLNFPDFTVDIPLDEGENYLTLFAQPDTTTEGDEFDRFAVNLYFDGNQEEPGISVLFPRYADPGGSPVSESRAAEHQVYSLAMQSADLAPPTFYDDGFHRVSVIRASMLPPARANVSVDRVQPKRVEPGDDSDWLGTLVVSVELSDTFGPGGGVPAPVGSSGSSGGRPGGAGTGNGPVGSGSTGYIPPGAYGQPVPAQQGIDGPYEDSNAEHTAPGDFWHEGDAVEESEDLDEAEGTPTPADLVGALEKWLQAAGDVTPSPSADDEEPEGEGTGTPAPTQTPASTSVPTTETPAMPASTPTGAATAATTPTPAVTGSLSPPPTVPAEKSASD